MKIFIASDLHGSAYWAEKTTEKFRISGANQLILLGDIYNHGPRNPFPDEYAPIKAAETLNTVADKIIAVQGNCDAEVDQMISSFPFVKEEILTLNGRRLFFTHGHVHGKDNVPQWLRNGDVMFYGHSHVSEIVNVNGVTCVNVGSASLPKDGKHAYCILTDNSVVVYDFDGNAVCKTAL